MDGCSRRVQHQRIKRKTFPSLQEPQSWAVVIMTRKSKVKCVRKNQQGPEYKCCFNTHSQTTAFVSWFYLWKWLDSHSLLCGTCFCPNVVDTTGQTTYSTPLAKLHTVHHWPNYIQYTTGQTTYSTPLAKSNAFFLKKSLLLTKAALIFWSKYNKNCDILF